MNRDEYHAWKKHVILSNGAKENDTVCLCPDGKRGGNNYAEIILTEDGSCPYLTGEGLCKIQKNYGVKEMTGTCRLFPREVHGYFGKAECSLSLGCERVLELLLEEKEGLFLEEGRPQRFEIYKSDYDIRHRRKYPKLWSYYDIQTLCLTLLQSDNMTMENRLLLIGIAMDKIEAIYKEGDGKHAAEYIGSFLGMAQKPEAGRLLEDVADERPLVVFNSVMSALLTLGFPDTFRGSVLGKAALGVDKKKAEKAENPEAEYYLECRERFSHWISGKEYFLENIMVMYLFWSNIPFKRLDKSMWENYLYLVWVYVMVKGCLIFAMDEDSTEEDMVDCCVVMFRKLGHNEQNFLKIIDAYRAEGDTPAHVAILLRNL